MCFAPGRSVVRAYSSTFWSPVVSAARATVKGHLQLGCGAIEIASPRCLPGQGLKQARDKGWRGMWHGRPARDHGPEAHATSTAMTTARRG
jgi:hypothetical protein